MGKIEIVRTGGPGNPPNGFLNGQNSLTEWYVYWALAKIFNNPRDPREAPFFGGWPDWEYQSSQLGGFTRALGSAVVDFVVHIGSTHILLRIQTEYFHLYTSSRKQSYDEVQRLNLEKVGRVIDVYDYDLLGDTTGQKAIITMKRSIGMLERASPLRAGTALRGTRTFRGRAQ